MSKRTSMLTLGAAAAVICAGSAFGQNTMVGGPHDFSTMGWSDGEICKPCHTPHFANEAVGWLWNHELTVATYDMHGGSGTAVDNFDILSRLCLSCHDGTVALDSFGGQTGSSYMPPEENLGTNLADDHPVGSDAIYPEAGNSSFAAADNHTLGAGALKLRSWIDGNGDEQWVVGCMTCHTPHNKGYDHQLRMDNAASAVCLACHLK